MQFIPAWTRLASRRPAMNLGVGMEEERHETADIIHDRVRARSCGCVRNAAAGPEDRHERADIFMFKTAVELPGVVLEPGEYEFRLAETPQRNVVQVLRREDMKPMGQFTFAPSERERATDETWCCSRKRGRDRRRQFSTGTSRTRRWARSSSIRRTRRRRSRPVPGRPSGRTRARSPLRPPDANPAPPAIPPAAGIVLVQIQHRLMRPRCRHSRQPPPHRRPKIAVSSTPEPPARSRRRRRVLRLRHRTDEPRPVGTSGIEHGATARRLRWLATSSCRTPRVQLPLSALIGLMSLAGAAGLRALRS